MHARSYSSYSKVSYDYNLFFFYQKLEMNFQVCKFDVLVVART